MGRSSVVGPALGGCIVIPLFQKRLSVAGPRDEAEAGTDTALRVISILGSVLGTPGTSTATVTATGTALHAGFTTVNRYTVAAEAKTFSGMATGQAFINPTARDLARSASGAAPTSRLRLSIATAGAVMGTYMAWVVCAVQSHRYDATLNPSISAKD